MAKESHYEKTLRIMAERNGMGKGPLSAEDRLVVLEQMRDNSLCWAYDCSEDRTAKGSASAMDLYNFARDEIKEHALVGATPESNPFVPEGFDFSRILTNGMGDRIEA